MYLPIKLDTLTILPFDLRINGNKALVSLTAPNKLTSKTLRNIVSDVVSISE